MNKDNGSGVNNDDKNGGGTAKEAVDADDDAGAGSGGGSGPSSGPPSRTTCGDLQKKGDEKKDSEEPSEADIFTYSRDVLYPAKRSRVHP